MTRTVQLNMTLSGYLGEFNSADARGMPYKFAYRIYALATMDALSRQLFIDCAKGPDSFGTTREVEKGTSADP
jgi:hypothetical protein